MHIVAAQKLRKRSEGCSNMEKHFDLFNIYRHMK